MAEEVNFCPNIPMKKWVSEPSPHGNCRQCFLGPVVSWYHTELEEKGKTDLAEQLSHIIETGSPESVAGTLDEIKDRVDAATAERLREFDCAAQLTDMEGETGETESAGH